MVTVKTFFLSFSIENAKKECGEDLSFSLVDLGACRYNLTIVRAIGRPGAAAAAVSPTTDGKDAEAFAGGKGYGNGGHDDDAGGLQVGGLKTKQTRLRRTRTINIGASETQRKCCELDQFSHQLH